MAHQLSPKAEADLDDIWLYVANESGSFDIATRLIDSITNQFFLLARHPYLGRTRDDEFGAGARSLAIGDYVIVYCVENGDVLILRVVHGRRDLESLLED
jgi:toxin ParE1/3/4